MPFIFWLSIKYKYFIYVYCMQKKHYILKGPYDAILKIIIFDIVTHQSRSNKATSASDRRPSTPWVLSGTAKLIRSDIYTGPTSCLIVPQTFSSLVFLSAFSIFRSLGSAVHWRLSLLHTTSRHAPYCWLAKSFFRHTARLKFKSIFEKLYTLPLMLKKYFSNTVHYCSSSMPRLSQTHRFQQSPSFRQAQSTLIGQLTQCIVIGRTTTSTLQKCTPVHLNRQ